MKHLSILIATFCITFGLQAQDLRSNTQGFSLSLHGAYGSWDSESSFIGTLDDEETNGFGGGIRMAYGISQRFEVFITYSGLGFSQNFDWNSYRLTTLHIGGRFNFGATLRRVRPFLDASLSYQAFNIDPITFDGFTVFVLKMDGFGGTIGGGLNIFLTQNLAITGNIKASFGGFNEVSLSGEQVNNLDESLDFTIITAHIGMSYYFH